MRVKDLIISSVSIIAAVTFFLAGGLQLENINSQRVELKLTMEKIENVPPSIAFATAATGVFRGLVVDALWMRAERLKMEKQFFDAKQLAEWITALQPRFPAVWDFQSWNMAYNISVTIPATEPQERWRWVKNGYELLRDKAIPLNPNNITLYRSLALIFQNKIGGITDDCHNYYKLQVALEMEPLLGAADNAYFKSLAQAPAEWKQITEDANMTPLLSALASADKSFSIDRGDDFVANYLALRQNPQQFGQQASRVINQYRGSPALEKIDYFARAYQLRKEWKLEPALMEQLNQIYGPVDWDDPNKHLPLEWRHPQTHAIYWAYKGLKESGREEFSLDLSSTDRIVNHGLQELFRQGKIYIYSVRQPVAGGQTGQQEEFKTIYYRPDLRMFKPYNESTIATMEIYKVLSSGTAEAMSTGHRNMLKNALLAFYQAGHRRQAYEIYQMLGKLYLTEDLKDSLDAYANVRFSEDLKQMGINEIRQMVQFFLTEAFFYYSMRDDNQAAINENLAKQAYELYYKQRVSPNIPGEDKRIGLLEFERIKYLALVDFFNDYQYPQALKESLLRRMEIEQPDVLKKIKEQEEQVIKEIQQQGVK